MATSDQEQCTYLVRVKTGNLPKAGTDSTISLELKSSCGRPVTVNNLKDWGIMDRSHKYFQQDNLDIFKVRATSLNDVSTMTISSNGEGNDAAWFCESVEVTVIRFGENKLLFPVKTWLQPPSPLSVTVHSSNIQGSPV